jgi:hypothetical protein
LKLSGLLYFANSLINLNILYDIFLYINLLFVIELYNNRFGYLLLHLVELGYGDKSGIFDYYCSVHPTMIDKVVVVSSH